MASTDAEREYNLISKLELRIASAPTDEKLEDILGKFLPALLLKLASSTERNRNLTIKICQYVNQRLKINSTIRLPVAALVKTFRENENGFVRRFCLIFIEQGLPRLETEQAIETLPGVLQFAVPKSERHEALDRKMWAIGFDFLLEVLRKWKVPERGSKDDGAMAEIFSLSTTQTNLLVTRFSDFLLYDPKVPSTAQSRDEEFFPVMDRNYKRRSEIALPIAKFLFTPLFTDAQRLIPAVIMSVDANASASNMSDVMFKQSNFDYESSETVDALFSLYKCSKPKLQTKILTLLSRSQTSTSRTGEIMNMVEAQLRDTGSTGLEASKLRAALFSYLTWMVRVGGEHLMGGSTSKRIQDLLKEYIEMQGWPTINAEQSQPGEMELRSKAYESIGLLAALEKESTDNVRTQSLIEWLFTSLRCDTTREIRSSIEESIGRIMNALPTSFLEDQTTSTRLTDLLLWNVLTQPGKEDPIYFLPTINSTTYPAVRFVNKCFAFRNVNARFIDVITLASTGDRREIVEEATRGLDPYWHASNTRLTSTPGDRMLELPKLVELVKSFFGGPSPKATYYDNVTALTAAVTFCRNILVCEALQDTTSAPQESTDWKQSIDALATNDQDARKRVRSYLQAVEKGNVLFPICQAALHGVEMLSSECLDISFEILTLAPIKFLSNIQKAGIDAASRVSANAGLQLRAARIFGILGSLDDNAGVRAKAEIEQASRWKTAFGEDSVKVQGHLLRACFCLTRRALRTSQEEF